MGRAGFEGVGLQYAPRLLFHSDWKCCLVFAFFVSPLPNQKRKRKNKKINQKTTTKNHKTHNPEISEKKVKLEGKKKKEKRED